jgi:hypothetical protein
MLLGFILYVGPDQLMPLTSVLASIVGLLLIFWTKLTLLVRRAAAWFKRPVKDPVKDLNR